MNPARCSSFQKCCLVHHAMPADNKIAGLKAVSKKLIERNEFFSMSKEDKSALYDMCLEREERIGSSRRDRKMLLNEIMSNVEGVSAVSLYIAQGRNRLPRMFYSGGEPKFFPDNSTCNSLNIIQRDNVFRSHPSGRIEHNEVNMRAESDAIGIPLISNGQKLGMLVVEGAEDRHFSLKGHKDLPFITRYLFDIANSYRDMMDNWFSPVTGLLNRMAYQSEVMPSMRTWLAPFGDHADYKFALLTVDLDKFKAINDTFGHGIGDVILCTSGEVMIKNTRNTAMYQGALRNYTDWVIHWGGDEFTIVLQNSDAAGALIVAERLRVALSNVGYEGDHIKKKHKTSKHISASIGILTSDNIRRIIAHDPDFDFNKLLDSVGYLSKGPRNAVSYLHGNEIVTMRGDKLLKKTPYKAVRQLCTPE